MTGRQALENLKKVPEDKLDLPLIGIHGSSGVSYEIDVYADVHKAADRNAGVLCDMTGKEYLWCSID